MRFLLSAIIAFSVNAQAGVHFFSAGSLGASVTSPPLLTRGLKNVNIHCIISSPSSVSGTFELRASNLDNPRKDVDADWVDITSTEQTASDTSTHMWNLSDRAFEWAQLTYTRTAGSGTVNCYAGREK
jgi:hypothetical protein